MFITTGKRKKIQQICAEYINTTSVLAIEKAIRGQERIIPSYASLPETLGCISFLLAYLAVKTENELADRGVAQTEREEIYLSLIEYVLEELNYSPGEIEALKEIIVSRMTIIDGVMSCYGEGRSDKLGECLRLLTETYTELFTAENTINYHDPETLAAVAKKIEAIARKHHEYSRDYFDRLAKLLGPGQS